MEAPESDAIGRRDAPRREPRGGADRGPTGHALYLLFTPSLCVADPWSTLDAAIDGGVDLIQWRAKSAADRAGYARFTAICARRDIPWIVNDDVHLACASDARGAHVGQTDLPAAAARDLLGPDRWLGVSTHDPAEIDAALAGGADHLGFGPMFDTATKGYAAGQTPATLAAALARAAPLPVFAIGGIHAGNLPALLAVGARRIAVSAAILRSPDPAAAAAGLAAALRTPRGERPLPTDG